MQEFDMSIDICKWWETSKLQINFQTNQISELWVGCHQISTNFIIFMQYLFNVKGESVCQD